MADYEKLVKRGQAKKHPLYGRWVGMRQRCNDKNHFAYGRYGGAGIVVCARWDDFSTFAEDMGDCPAGYSIERKDNALGYTPENCVWAHSSQQSRNRSMTVWIEFDGRTMCLSDWATELGLSFSAMKERVAKWGIERALTIPKLPNHGRKSYVTAI